MVSRNPYGPDIPEDLSPPGGFFACGLGPAPRVGHCDPVIGEVIADDLEKLDREEVGRDSGLGGRIDHDEIIGPMVALEDPSAVSNDDSHLSGEPKPASGSAHDDWVDLDGTYIDVAAPQPATECSASEADHERALWGRLCESHCDSSCVQVAILKCGLRRLPRALQGPIDGERPTIVRCEVNLNAPVSTGAIEHDVVSQWSCQPTEKEWEHLRYVAC